MRHVVVILVLVLVMTGSLFAAGKDAPAPKSGPVALQAAGTANDWPADLRAAVKTSEIQEMKDYNRGFWILEFPAKTEVRKILAEVSNTDLADMDKDMFKMEVGDAAIRKLAADWRKEAKELDSDGRKASAKVYENVAKAMEDAFAGMQDLAKTQVARHNIAEDGDTEYKAVLTKKQDGSWFVLAYYNFPY